MLIDSINYYFESMMFVTITPLFAILFITLYSIHLFYLITMLASIF